MFVQRPDARLLALSFGQGPLSLLALGGWCVGAEVWQPVFGELPCWRCVGYDHRGAGASRCEGEITFDAMVDDLFAVASAMRLDRPVLAAESSGAAVALAAARRDPARFAGLVLVGAAWQRVPAGGTARVEAALRADLAGAYARFARDCLPEPGSEALQHWGAQMLGRASLADAIALLRTREQATVDEEVEHIALPTLLLHGTADRIVPPAASQALAARMPDAELELLDGLGHAPMLSDPARIARRIEARFVNAQWRERGGA